MATGGLCEVLEIMEGMGLGVSLTQPGPSACVEASHIHGRARGCKRCAQSATRRLSPKAPTRETCVCEAVVGWVAPEGLVCFVRAGGRSARGHVVGRGRFSWTRPQRSARVISSFVAAKEIMLGVFFGFGRVDAVNQAC